MSVHHPLSDTAEETKHVIYLLSEGIFRAKLLPDYKKETKATGRQLQKCATVRNNLLKPYYTMLIPFIHDPCTTHSPPSPPLLNIES